ncbi:ROK family transcriptional regulator [Halalkalibacterium halodurans]|jgi:predicted NBD/HSP70 family sugar kinase|uniref:ROK family protein n=1 Tax=Halalkalibacterium halodurans TaxID=86665 RepID=A0A0M0KIN5_ALKHA|nr:ROK family transcriptional regulator [Halalkalibacterium halodurans]MED3647954.1 ROK family transcriptional regulator [Halalkalibacterium halodurans]MED4164799.1 ROK family transcriptional regulator [Halalkalibacterium halodurans]TPE68934.1 ROK family transcriptional regulator [Halalkalibacterium halodurans]
MSVTGDQRFIKQMNKQIVLQTIRKEAPLSRAQVSLTTGLNKGTVSSLVAELIADNLVYEVGPGESSGGRRPVMLMFQNKAAFAIGINIAVNYLSGVLTDLVGNVLEKVEWSLHVKEFDHVNQQMVQLIEQLMKAAPPSTYGIIGIGVAVPGIVNEEGDVLFAPNLNWREIPLKKQLEEHFQLPIAVENEANAGALGEKVFGKGKESENMIFFSIGIGIGSGIIFGNSLYRGKGGYSGEVGHMSIETNGPLCTCGNKGCWELFASEKAVLQQGEALYEEVLTLDDLFEKARKGEQTAIDLFQKIGVYLGTGIANMINALNPELVVVGNRMVKGRPWLEHSLKQTVADRALSFHAEQVSVEFSDLNENGISLGVSYLLIDSFLEKKHE